MKFVTEQELDEIESLHAAQSALQEYIRQSAKDGEHDRVLWTQLCVAVSAAIASSRVRIATTRRT